jgi:hypothetical protein
MPMKRPIRERMRLPHERDESSDPGVAPARDLAVEQGADDVNRGLVDTERRGSPTHVPAPRRREKPRSDPRA